jgi:hypothetical protein
MTVIDQAKPYIRLVNFTQEDAQIKIKFTVNGCTKVDQTRLIFLD